MLGMTVDEMEDMKAEIARRAKEAEKEKEHEMLRNMEHRSVAGMGLGCIRPKMLGCTS